MNTTNAKIGEHIRTTIKRSGLSFAAVSRGTGISISSLHRKLTGGVSFTVREVLAIARVIGVDASALIPREAA